MDIEELEALKAAAKIEYQQSIQAAKDRYKKAIESIDGVTKLKNRLEKPARLRGRLPGSRSTTGLMSNVSRIVLMMEGQFTLSDIEIKFGDMGLGAPNRASLATAMRRYLDENRSNIVLVEEGRGRRAAIYENKQPEKIILTPLSSILKKNRRRRF